RGGRAIRSSPGQSISSRMPSPTWSTPRTTPAATRPKPSPPAAPPSSSSSWRSPTAPAPTPLTDPRKAKAAGRAARPAAPSRDSPLEPRIEAQPETAGRQNIDLSAAKLADGDRGAGVVEVVAFQADPPLAEAVAEARRPGGVRGSDSGVHLVQKALVDPVVEDAAVPALRREVEQAGRDHVAGREHQLVAPDLGGAVVEDADEVLEAGVVKAVGEAPAEIGAELVVGFELGPPEPLLAGVDQARQPVAVDLRHHQVREVHLEDAQLPIQIAGHPLGAGLVALGGLGVQDRGVRVGAEVEGGGLEGVAVVAVEPDAVVAPLPGEPAQSHDAAAAGDRLVV